MNIDVTFQNDSIDVTFGNDEVNISTDEQIVRDAAIISTLPTGGMPGDVLVKESENDYAAEWVTPADQVANGDTRPVTSAGVYDALSFKADATDIPSPSSTIPIVDGEGLAGSSLDYARADHVHPHDTTKQDVLTFDNSPTEDSVNPVKSGGVYSALASKADTADIPSASSTTPIVDGTAAIGSSTDYARADHVHPTDTTRAAVSDIPTASSTTPIADGTAAVGSSTDYARADHVHPHDTTKQDVLTFDNSPTEDSVNPVKSGGIYSALASKADTADIPSASSITPIVDGTAAIGSSTDYARADHVHPTDTSRAAMSDIPSAYTLNPAMDGIVSPGLSASWAKGDHVHPHDTSKQDILTFDDEPTEDSSNPVTSSGVYNAIAAKADSSDVPTPSSVTPYEDGIAAVGSSTDYARADHVHPHDTSKQDILTFDNSPTEDSVNPVKSGGVYSALASKADTADIPSASSTTPIVDGTAAIGSSTDYARADHVHPTDTTRAAVSAIPTASTSIPVMDGIGTAGTSTKFAKGDHVHPTDTTRMAANLKGTAYGVAELDSNGKVPSSQLPSYVDDVLEYNNFGDFPVTGESGKIYIALDTNLTYRWGGSSYVLISSSLALGETSSTAYRGDRGKAAYDHFQNPYTSSPVMDGSASPGSSTAWARGDHVHPHDTTKQDVLTFDNSPTEDSVNPVKSGGVYSALASKADTADIPSASSTTPIVDGTAAIGSSTDYARADHVHPTDTTRAAVSDIPSAYTSDPEMNGTASAGSSTAWAKGDHVHPHDTTKQDTLTFDVAPTVNSINPVESGGVFTAVDDVQKMLASVESSSTASKAYAVGDLLIVNGKIYSVIAAISSGGTITPNTNVTETTIEDELGNTHTALSIMSYGNSTWNEFITAYTANALVYCRASSNSNPASGSQTRMAFMAYVNNATNPTEVEFQYYRSIATHTDGQQGDQVFVYKLNKTNGWSVTVRNAFTKIVAGTGLSSSYSSSGQLTLSVSSTSSSTITNNTDTDLTGLLKGNGSKVSTAVAGTDYQTPLVAGTDYATPAQLPPTVTANPTLIGTESDLTSLEVGSTKYKVPSNPLPSGGTVGDILIKNSSTNYDIIWAAPASSAIQGSDLPITSGAVYTILGDINTLLATI